MKYVDVVVPYFFPPYIGGTETVLRKWDAYFGSHKLTDLKVRFVLPFAYHGSNVFNHRGDYIFGWRLFDNKLMRVFGVINLLVYLIFTKADNLVVLSPNYIRLSYRIRKIFHKHYRITDWIHFSLDQKFVDNQADFRLADYHLAISTGIKQQLLDMGISDKKILTVFNPIEATTEQIVDSNHPKYIYVGRLEYRGQKNLQELLHGFFLVRKELPEAQLEFWGSGPDVSRLHELVHQLQLDSCVSFRGWHTDPWSEISAATAFVLTSTYEGLPMSILEAMSHGLPVVSANVATGPMDEITSENGLLYEPGDLDELKDKMIEVSVNRKNYQGSSIKASIKQFYTENYFKNLLKNLQEMG